MHIIALDFETYFDADFNLKKLTTEEYVRSDQFEVLVMGVYAKDYEPRWFSGAMIGQWLRVQDWSNTALVAHHAHFDGLILSEKYGIKPKYWLDTLSMARLVIGTHISHGLGALAKHFDLGVKDVPYELFKGRRLCNMERELVEQLGEACAQDAVLTMALFEKLAASFPQEEYKIIDITVRMFTEPTLMADKDVMRKIQVDEWTRKNEKLIELGVTKKDLASKTKFAALLEEQQIVVETKDGKNGPIYALAKTDEFMQGLLEHPNDRVAALADARLDVASTINETRSGKLADMAERGPLPIYLNYCGAHTTRWSGAGSVNFQNFPRGGAIRKALHAPDGHLLAICDMSQIECRILNYVAGQWDIIEAFETGRDLYSEGASRFYGKKITKEANPLERHVGKVLELGCGYGMGAKKLQVTCRRGTPRIELTDAEAARATASYRDSHKMVTQYWRTGDQMLHTIANSGSDIPTEWGPLVVSGGKILLPNGASLLYDLSYNALKGGWLRKTKKGYENIWGGGLVENVVQAMARVVMSQAMSRLYDKGYKIVTTIHDEIVVCVPEEGAQDHYAIILEELRKTPSWLPGIPLNAEGCVSKFYSK